jgi:hypothetical protein
MISWSSLNMGHLGSKAGHTVEIWKNLVNTLEATVCFNYSGNLSESCCDDLYVNFEYGSARVQKLGHKVKI